MADQPSFITGSGEIFRPFDETEAAKLRQLGLKEATAGDEHHDELRQQYSSWMYAATAETLGAVHTALPGATGAVLTGLDKVSHGAAQGAANFIEGVQAGNPVAYGAGMLAGGVVQLGINTAAEFTPAGPAGAAAVGAASFMGMTFDDLALKHINTPEGAEKTAAALATAGVIGAGLGLTGFGVAAWIGKKGLSVMGAKLQAGAEKTLAKETAVGNPGVAARLEETGAVEKTNELIKKYDLLGQGKAGVETRLTAIAKKAEKAMQEAKSVTTETMDMASQVSYARNLQMAVGDTPKFMEKVAGAPFRKPQTVAELHALRTELDDAVNWAETTSPLSQRMIAARDIVDEQITKTFQHAAETSDSDLVLGQLSRWQTANADFSAAKALQDALKYSEATGKSLIQNVGKWVSRGGAGTAGVSALHGNVPGVLSGLGAYGAGKVIQESGAFIAKGVVGAGKMMQSFDGSFLSTVLGQTAVAITTKLTATAGVLGLPDYLVAAASTTHSTEDPTKAVQDMAQTLEDQKVPGAIIDAVVPQNIRALQYLNSQVPKSPWTGTTVAPVPWAPSLKQKSEFLEKANAVSNPLEALRNPTPAKMEALRAVYPIMGQQAALIAAQHAATKPNLSLRQRRRLSLITGQPATPLSSPLAQGIMAQVNAQAQQTQHDREAQVGHRRGAASGSMVNSSQTQLGRMSSDSGQ